MRIDDLGTLSDLSASAQAILASLASPFTQDHRIVRLDFARNAGIASELLLAHRVRGREAISRLYRLDVEVLSADSFIELKTLLGAGVAVRILTAEGDERAVTGVVTHAEQAGADGGLARYQLRVEPAFAVLEGRINSRVFQDKSVPQIVKAVLQEHTSANPVFTRHFRLEDRTTQSYALRSYCIQYRESDRAFIDRLLAEEGISYTWQFEAGDEPLHTLVLFDDAYAIDQAEPGAIRFHRADGTEEADTITDWRGARAVGTAASTLASFDYKLAATHLSAASGAIDQGETGTQLGSTLEAYDPQGLYYASDGEGLERYAALRQQARDLAAKTFSGRGSVRALATGQWFELQDHPIHEAARAEQRQFVVLSQEWIAQNNLPSDLALRTERSQGHVAKPYETRFTAVRRGVPIVPEYSRTEHAKPTARGPQTAVVVGPPAEEIHTDELGRVKVQFHWQRAVDHPEGGAAHDDGSSTWVRVAYPSAGVQWGSQCVPRIGQEVLIEFIEGDIDRPVVVGVLYNGRQRPPEFSGVGSLPGNKTLSGIKSKEYKGAGYNELLFDDSTGQIKAKLSSEHAKSQLNLGYLTHPRADGTATPRGEGVELRTDAAAVIRAAQGVLISAQARLQAGGNQLDRAEHLGALKVLGHLQKHLGELASIHQADDTDVEKLAALATHLENWDQGSNTRGGKPDPGGGKPLVAIDAPAGLSLNSHDNLVLGATTHIDVVSSENTQLSVGRRLLVRAVQSVSIFAHRLGMKLIAASGKVVIEAHNDNIETTSAKKTIVTALDEIVLRAPRVTIETQGAKTEIGHGGITTQCQGTHTQKAGNHVLAGLGGGSASGELPASSATYDEKFVLRFANGAPMKNLQVRIKDSKGKALWSGRTNDRGETELLSKDMPQGIDVEFC